MISRSSIARSNLARILGSLVMLEVMFFYAVNAQAGKASLAWDANTESTLGGYQLYYGQARRRYTANVDVGKKTTHTLSDLQGGKKYYFAVKAYSKTKKTWSGYSNEVSKTIGTTSSGSAPKAKFSASRTSGTAPLAVTFADSSTGNITARFWKFGDGTTSTAKHASKSYSRAGTYTVSLTVKGPKGSHATTKRNFISVSARRLPISRRASTRGGSGGSSRGNAGLVAAYNFEEASGTRVVDASGKGNHGIIRGAKRVSKGKFGKALSFDGVNDWVTVNDSVSLDLRTGMTLEAWVYPTVFTSGWRTVMHKEVDRYYLMAGFRAGHARRRRHLYECKSERPRRIIAAGEHLDVSGRHLR